MIWTPTMSLRFIKRYASDEKIMFILQQMWVSSDGFTEWRDIPLVEYYD